jgi:hypothetical protein
MASVTYGCHFVNRYRLTCMWVTPLFSDKLRHKKYDFYVHTQFWLQVSWVRYTDFEGTADINRLDTESFSGHDISASGFGVSVVPHLIRRLHSSLHIRWLRDKYSSRCDTGHQPKARVIQWTQVLKCFCKGLSCIIRRPLCIFRMLDYCINFNVIKLGVCTEKRHVNVILIYIYPLYTKLKLNFIPFFKQDLYFVSCTFLYTVNCIWENLAFH